MLFKLLWRNQSLWQILGASLGALTGITLLLMTLQTRESFHHVLENEDELFPAKYLTLSKKVSLLSNLPGMRPSFSNREIENLKKTNDQLAISNEQLQDLINSLTAESEELQVKLDEAESNVNWRNLFRRGKS